ncbi:hypothetical protein J2S00_000904 [Caldalkalibacillus uzonensis]|uniref:Uncharacterized protein n=1 Tax=Caldalkalibacillus uzonensis TaxID=353224 RepID=A0ABU0CNX6_9BACI|nr:hypothetical protein [Caldalkalibacillus uzonensis]
MLMTKVTFGVFPGVLSPTVKQQSNMGTASCGLEGVDH